MLWFPQLATGTAMQFPGTKRVVRRTVLSESADGRRVKLADPGAALSEWQLEFRGLTDAERGAIETLFAATEGRLGSFGFLDPFGNLARWSEDLGAVTWVRDSGVLLTPGVADPLGGSAATRVEGPGRVRQTLSVPGWFQYCASVWVRGGDVRVFLGPVEGMFEGGAAWRRVSMPARLSGTGEAVELGVEVAGAAEVFGFQVEAQAGASKYKRTTSRSGVFSSASFAEDALAMTADGVNNHSARVRIQAR